MVTCRHDTVTWYGPTELKALTLKEHSIAKSKPSLTCIRYHIVFHCSLALSR